MCVIYILSGRVFGKNIYEISCTSNIIERVNSETTGFPGFNTLHYSSIVKHSDVKTCQDMVINSLYTFQMKTGNNFYKIDLNEAIEQMNKIVLNIKYTYEYEIDQENTYKNNKKLTCF